MKTEAGRRVRDNMGKAKYHVACTLQRENGTRGRNFTVRGFLSDGSETPELSLRPLFEQYRAQVGG
jgi:hypothetical protein